ncbi:MAG: hypothetical protein UFJ18_12360 [Blautia sp.]|nr:hypothetical protein [Blautia sp.]
MEKVKYIQLSNLQTSYSSHNKLAKLYADIHSCSWDFIIINFEKVSFISANQFSVLGCILTSFLIQHKNTKISFTNLSPKIKEIMQVNGFGKHFSLEPLPDKNNTAIPYKIFNVSQIDEFERYIGISIFNRNDLPRMSCGVRDRITDNILEIFNNVKEHTKSELLYTCGQYFPRKGFLYFTIVDSGETIPHNVSEYLKDSGKSLNQSETALHWALQCGNSTRRTNSPGGLGLYFLSDFIKLNKGELYIVSGNETFEQTAKYGQRYKSLSVPFQGTIVTMAFNLSDTSSYCLSSEDLTDLIF